MSKTRGAGVHAGEETSTHVPPTPPPRAHYLSAAESAERLGITVRHFKKRIAQSPIEGVILDGAGASARKLYPESAIDELLIESAEEETQSAIASIMKHAALVQVEINKSATPLLQSVQLAIDAGVSALQGTDPRTQALIEENKRLREHAAELEKNALGFWELMREMHDTHTAEMKAAAVRERDRILENSRHEGLSRAFEMALPGLIHRVAPSRETEKSILAKVIEVLPAPVREQIMPALLGNIPPELAASLHALIQDALEDEAKRQEKKAAATKPASEAPAPTTADGSPS